MSIEASVPVPLDPLPPPEADDKRLWIGNIDMRLTEYHLLKLLQKHGKMKKFDFLFHKSGPHKGLPRGYCFVTYETREQAESAISALDGKTVLSKPLNVKWAHTVPMEEAPVKKNISSSTEEPKQVKNVDNQISAIEAKLKAMEEQREKDLELCLTAIPVGENGNSQQPKKCTNNNHRRSRSGPYNRPEHKFYSTRTVRKR